MTSFEATKIQGNLLLSEGFTPLELHHRSLVEPFLQNGTRHSCSTFSFLWIWNSYENFWFKIHNENLILLSLRESVSLPLLPRGEGNPVEALEYLQTLLPRLGMDRMNIEYIDELEKNRLPDFDQFVPCFDFVYKVQDLIDLPGSQYANRRKGRNHFLKNFPRVESLPFTTDHLTEGLKLLETLSTPNPLSDRRPLNLDGSPLTPYELNKKRNADLLVCKTTLESFQELQLVGMGVFIDKQLVGFTFGETLEDNTCSILVEKIDRRLRGLSEFIWSEFLKRHWSQYEYCNAGDDWGIPSLAWTKESYHPSHKIAKWRAEKKIWSLTRSA